MLQRFIFNDENIERNSYLYNMTGSLLMAFQSVILLMILTRSIGLEASGIFVFAFANANLILSIGRYGMRPYQASDVKMQFSFLEYRISRRITTIAMLAVSIGFVFVSTLANDYNFEKSMTLFLMCVFKAADAIEDIYYGLYQQKGRLDVAGKALTIRLALTTVIFGVGIVLFESLLLALLVATIFTYVMMTIILVLTYRPFKVAEKKVRKQNVILLLKLCFPLFAGSFLSFFIGNAPRYAIDTLLTYEMQAIYGFISMPVFVIGLLISFVFNPMIQKMSRYWNEGNTKVFVKWTILQSLMVVGITAICILGAYFLGIPVLSALYSADLSGYRRELLILLVGGGFLGMSGLFTVLITIIRYQKWVLLGYGIASLLALVLSFPMVRDYGIMGASVLYVLNMGVLSLSFVVILVVGVYAKNRH